MIQTFFKFLACFFIIPSTLFCVNCSIHPRSTFDIGFGYNQEDVIWKARAPEDVLLDVQSQLKFKDLSVFLVTATAKYFMNCWFYTRFYGDYGLILNKPVGEFDSFGIIVPPETIVKTHTQNNATFGRVGNGSLGIGTHFQLMAGTLTMAPTIGFAYHTQCIDSTNRNTVVDALLEEGVSPAQIEDIGFIPTNGGKNKYQTSWWGPWFGLDFIYNTCTKWFIFGEFEFHFTSRCEVKRKSNIGLPYFDHYHETHDARGFTSKVGANYYWAYNWYTGFNLNYQYFKSHREEHRETNRINWRSIGIGGELGVTF